MGVNVDTPCELPIRMVVDGWEVFLPELSTQLDDGRTGWYQRSNDTEVGCFRAVLATALRVDWEEAPATIDIPEAVDWAARRGFLATYWVPYLEWPPNAETWIGFDAPGEDGFCHTVVGSYDRLIHDPTDGWQPRSSVLPCGPLVYAISFERVVPEC
jgi:hypothetical protein